MHREAGVVGEGGGMIGVGGLDGQGQTPCEKMPGIIRVTQIEHI